MRFLLRPANQIVLVSYFFLSAVPFIFLAPRLWRSQGLTILAAEFVAWLTIWAIFKRPAWFHWLTIPAFLAFPVEIYLQTYFGQGISPHHLGIIVETSPKEALEFLGSKIWLLGAIMVFVLGWFSLTWMAALRTKELDWSDNSRWVMLTILAALAGVWGYGEQIGVNSFPTAEATSALDSTAGSTSHSDIDTDASVEPEKVQAVVSADSLSSSSVAAYSLPPLPVWATIPFRKEVLGNSWPFGLIVQAQEFWQERVVLTELAEKNRNFSFGAKQSTSAETPQVMVVVIGESSRYDRWSLNGYQRETNPLLKAEANLVSLTSMVTPVSATRLSVPVIMSRKRAVDSLKAGFSEKSFLTAFKEAGFKTYWLSNQMSFGQFDTPVSVIAKEAEIIQFLNLGGFTNQSNLDEVLLVPLKNAINDPAPKKLIVIHTLGNHWNYSHRYPKEYDKWQPSLFGVSKPDYTDLDIKPEINNSYDNSILYTDWFLAQVIGALKATPQLTSMMYVSDHGQTLYDGSCRIAFHGHNTRHEFHIPAFVWYSDLYRDTYPEKVSRLLRNRRAKLSTENVFHSLVDMADIRYGTEQLERSFVSKQLRFHKRYVDSYGWTDYDQSTFKGDCKEVMAKGKPLLRD